MNILEAYLIQKGQFVIVFSSPDEELLKDVVSNLSEDFGAVFINLFPFLKDIENIDNKTIGRFFNIERKVIFVIAPAFPTGYIKNLKFDYHVSVSLNSKLIKEKGIDNNVLKIYNDYGSIKYSYKKNNKNNEVRTSINKTLNLSKFSSNKLLEDQIFNLLIEFINIKLDSGKYLEKLEGLKSVMNQKKIVYKKDEIKEPNTDHIDEEIIEEIDSDYFYNDDDIMREVNFETAESDFIIGGVRKLNK